MLLLDDSCERLRASLDSAEASSAGQRFAASRSVYYALYSIQNALQRGPADQKDAAVAVKLLTGVLKSRALELSKPFVVMVSDCM
ncbi:unnamed protein product, partial [Chrysoparadoxa australica]